MCEKCKLFWKNVINSINKQTATLNKLEFMKGIFYFTPSSGSLAALVSVM